MRSATRRATVVLGATSRQQHHELVAAEAGHHVVWRGRRLDARADLAWRSSSPHWCPRVSLISLKRSRSSSSSAISRDAALGAAPSFLLGHLEQQVPVGQAGEAVAGGGLAQVALVRAQRRRPQHEQQHGGTGRLMSDREPTPAHRLLAAVGADVTRYQSLALCSPTGTARYARRMRSTVAVSARGLGRHPPATGRRRCRACRSSAVTQRSGTGCRRAPCPWSIDELASTCWCRRRWRRPAVERRSRSGGWPRRPPASTHHRRGADEITHPDVSARPVRRLRTPAPGASASAGGEERRCRTRRRRAGRRAWCGR